MNGIDDGRRRLSAEFVMGRKLLSEDENAGSGGLRSLSELVENFTLDSLHFYLLIFLF